MKQIFLLILLSISILIACKEEPKEITQTPVQQDSIPADTVAKTVTPARDPTLTEDNKTKGNSYSHSTEDHEGHEEIAKAMKNSFLIDEIWKVEAIIDVGEASAQKFKNEAWYFGTDGKYKHTLEDGSTDTGTFKFDEDAMNIELIPSSSKFSHSEWHMRLGGSMMIWTGTSTYKNNSRMIKMNRVIRDRSLDLK